MHRNGVRVVAVCATAALVLALGAWLWPARPEPQQAAQPRTAPARFTSQADRQIEAATAAVQSAPERAAAHVELAAGFMNKARETGDGSYYARAEAACARALELAPDHYPALRLVSWVYAGQHRFREARAAAERALARVPDDPWNHGMLGDALIELGEYEAAAEAFQRMMDLRPGVPAYARASHVRELYGDLDGAIEAMGMAVDASSPRDAEEHAWCRSQLGQLYFQAQRPGEAEAEQRAALAVFPDYHPALTGLGRVLAAQGRADEASEAYRRSLAIAPTHDAAVELGDLLLGLGRAEEAEQQYALLDVIETLQRANGVEPEAQMALFYADHDRKLGEALAIAERVAERQPTIRAQEALAWALYKNGRLDEALAASQKALRLGTRDAALHYRAGLIRARLGQREEAAALLRQGLALHPKFPRRLADEARRTLAALTGAEAAGS